MAIVVHCDCGWKSKRHNDKELLDAEVKEHQDIHHKTKAFPANKEHK